MPTLLSYLTKMIEIGPADVGFDFPAATFTAQAAAIPRESRLAEDFYEGYWLFRPTTGDVRAVESYDADTGELQFTTAPWAANSNAERLQAWRFHPTELKGALSKSLGALRRQHVSEFVQTGGMRLWQPLNEMDWVRSSLQIQAVTWMPSRIISRDRYILDREGPRRNNIPGPDHWSVAEDVGLAEPTDMWRLNPFPLSLTGAGTISQALPWLPSSYRYTSNSEVTLTATLKGQNGGKATLSLSPHTDPAKSEEYELDGEWQTFSWTYGIPLADPMPSDMRLTFDGDILLGEFFAALGELTEMERRGEMLYAEQPLTEIEYRQTSQSLMAVVLATMPIGARLRFYSNRGYRGFGDLEGIPPDAVAWGPEEEIASGAIAELYEREAQRIEGDNRREVHIAVEWRARFREYQILHRQEQKQLSARLGRSWGQPAAR